MYRTIDNINIKGIIGFGIEKNENNTFISSFNSDMFKRVIEVKFNEGGYFIVGAFSDILKNEDFLKFEINDNSGLRFFGSFVGFQEIYFSFSSVDFFFCLENTVFFLFLDYLILEIKGFKILQDVKKFYGDKNNFEEVFKVEEDLKEIKIGFFINNFKLEIPLFVKCPEDEKINCFLFKPDLFMNKIGLYFLEKRILRIDYNKMNYYISKKLTNNDFRIKDNFYSKDLAFFIGLLFNSFFIFFFVKKNLYLKIDELNQHKNKDE